MKKPFLFISILSLFAIAGCSPVKEDNIHEAAPGTIAISSPEGRTFFISAEIADTPEERITGLMYRKELEEGHGMLFVFTKEQILSFWMKNTLVPLDIVFFDKNKNYVSSLTMKPCKTENCPMYLSENEALYALEMQAGVVDSEGIGEGWKINTPNI